MKKKVICAILICIVIAGIIVVATIGFNTNIEYSKNVELDIYIDASFETSDIKDIVKEVFGTNDVSVQEVELFGDMVAIEVPDTLDDDELNSKVEELNNELNEKYELENTTDDIEITHNPKIRLSSLIKPYAVTLIVSMVIILVYAAIRYRKVGPLKTVAQYLIGAIGAELLLASIVAITRIPVTRVIIPIGLFVLVIVLTIISLRKEKELEELKEK